MEGWIQGFSHLILFVSIVVRIVCFDTDYPNEGKVKYIIEHSSMNTVYAITSDSKKSNANDGCFDFENIFFFRIDLLFAVSGRDLLNQAQGFTFSIHPDSFGRLLQTWKPAKVRFSVIYFSNFSILFRISVNLMI